ncbi:MAG: VCBS repeat-containing protein [Stigonema ocellatum SAG 48.90 = DSM 106950]|nr:VCBS repeat-containing protein [Stigonema ocellatum SAG 48.90 = DSM 106950]
MKTSKFFKAFGLATAVTFSSFGMWLVNQGSASAVDITPKGWCVHAGSYILYGDFDGDNRTDALCADHGNGKWINYGNGRTWYKQSSWCTHAGAYIHVVDLDRDGYDDLECRDTHGSIWYEYADYLGKFDF